jgi:type I restriction enzyme, R subunit
MDGMSDDKIPQYLKLDERDHVEKPFLDQLDGLGWEIIDLDSKQHPSDSFRQSFTEVVMLPVLREQLIVINDWMEEDQVEEVVKQLTAGPITRPSSICSMTKTSVWSKNLRTSVW